MKYQIHYFNRWAEGWYAVKSGGKTLEFDSEALADAFLANPRGWPRDVDSRALNRAVDDSDIQIVSA